MLSSVEVTLHADQALVPPAFSKLSFRFPQVYSGGKVPFHSDLAFALRGNRRAHMNRWYLSLEDRKKNKRTKKEEGIKW